MQLKISENIKNLRNERKFTQAALAEKMQVTVQAVSKWETGESCPEISLLPELAEFFGVTADYLLTGKSLENAVKATEYFPDDGVYRVAEFFGSRLMQADESGNHRIALTLPETDERMQSGEKIAFHIMGNAEIAGDVAGAVIANGSVMCGDVAGDVNAGAYVECDDVFGNVSAGGYVECGDVGGSVTAGVSLTCGTVLGSATKGDSLSSILGNPMGTEMPLRKNPAYKHPMTYVLDLGVAGNLRFGDNTSYGDSTISTRQACIDFSWHIRNAQNPPEIGDSVRVTGKLISPIDIDKLLVGLVDNSREADCWLVLDKDGENYLKQNTYVYGIKAGEPFELDVTLKVKQNMRRLFSVQLAYGEQNGGCVTMEAHKRNEIVCK